jgi:hypothetical protein
LLNSANREITIHVKICTVQRNLHLIVHPFCNLQLLDSSSSHCMNKKICVLPLLSRAFSVQWENGWRRWRYALSETRKDVDYAVAQLQSALFLFKLVSEERCAVLHIEHLPTVHSTAPAYVTACISFCHTPIFVWKIQWHSSR